MVSLLDGVLGTKTGQEKGMKEATKNLEGVQGVSASKNHPVVSQGSFMILSCFFCYPWFVVGFY